LLFVLGFDAGEEKTGCAGGKGEQETSRGGRRGKEKMGREKRVLAAVFIFLLGLLALRRKYKAVDE
jgi:hypothetical protein